MLQGDQILKNLFKNYYKRNGSKIQLPRHLYKREFGFILFGKENQMIRHISFKKEGELYRFFREKYPRHAYFSTAYYTNPEAPTMKDKEWLGADLVFDIDIDHIPTPCKETHDKWMCLDCGFLGKGMVPPKCPECGSERIKKETWVCKTCIDFAKRYTLRLVDFLLEDLGFSLNEIEIVFSGHRGFHVHVISEDIVGLEQKSRREIINFVRGEGLTQYVLDRIKTYGYFNLSVETPGWHSRLARTIYEILVKMNKADYKKLGLSKKALKLLEDNRDRMLQEFEEKMTWKLPLGFEKKDLEKILNYAISMNNVPIDERVTIDLRRLIRVVNSLHGRTGLKAIKLKYHDLENFSIRKAVVFDKPEYIKIKWKHPPLHLLDYKLTSSKTQIIPFYLGIYIIGNHIFDIEIIDII